jgi:hypothetical protein
VAQGHAPQVSEARVRWKLPMIEQCYARFQKISQRFVRSPRFWYWSRSIASAR